MGSSTAHEKEEREEGELEVGGASQSGIVTSTPSTNVRPEGTNDDAGKRAMAPQSFAGAGPQMRLVKLQCDTLPPQQSIAIIDAVAHPDGVSIGRDRIYTPRIRIPAMKVSKHHANIFPLNPTRSKSSSYTFAIVDTGSTHGTFVQHSSRIFTDRDDAELPSRSAAWQERLSAPKEASKPYMLRHLTLLRVGDTVFQVHHHATSSSSSRFASSCDVCALHEDGSGEIALVAASKPKTQLQSINGSAGTTTKLSHQGTSDGASTYGVTEPRLGDRTLDSEAVRRQAMKDLRSKHLSKRPANPTQTQAMPSKASTTTAYIDRAAARRDRLGWGGATEPIVQQQQQRQPHNDHQRPKETHSEPRITSSAPAAALDESNKGYKMFAAMAAATSFSSTASTADHEHRNRLEDPIMARGVEGRAGLGSKRLLDVQEIAQRTHDERPIGYGAEASHDRQRRRYEEASSR